MVAYRQFVELSGSGDSEERGRAAHFAAMAFVGHKGPADEQAALYAALISFLDDASVKVRAALAYGLLHAKCAPRPIMVSLLQDAPIIARAVAQYSPVLVDADLLSVIKTADEPMLDVIAERPNLTLRVAQALIWRDVHPISLKVLARHDVEMNSGMLDELATKRGAEGKIRGALLLRKELSAAARYQLVEQVRNALATGRIVKGAIAPRRLSRLMRDATDTAMTAIGEREAAAMRSEFSEQMVADDKISSRVMLHAIVSGHVLFFADCLAQLAAVPRAKVFALLNDGSRAGLNALFAKCSLSEAVRNLLARLIFYARSADLADDIAARHFVVTSLIEELIVEHDGVIPQELEEAFGYLNEQNVKLARQAARGVMPAFAENADDGLKLPGSAPDMKALPAA